jgi:hypothetical protein
MPKLGNQRILWLKIMAKWLFLHVKGAVRPVKQSTVNHEVFYIPHSQT